MLQNGTMGKQHGKLVTTFRLLIFKVFFIHGEILEYICQFYSFRTIMMCTVSENQSRFFRFPGNHWVVLSMVYDFHPTTFFQLSVYTLYTYTCEKLAKMNGKFS